MVLGELLIFIIVLIGIVLIPVGYQMYTTTRLIWGGILTMIYGILCFVATLSGIISLI
jgi:hypothetical protein